MGTMLYYIDADWTGLHAMLVGATGFSGEHHTGDNIRRQTELDLESVGLTFEDIHAKVSDQGSNIKKVWGGLPGGYCTAHTLEFAVKEYLEADGVANVVKKTKGMTTYFHHSSNRLSRLSDLQKELQVAVNQPPQTGNAVCWHYTHDSMNWFHEQKRVVQTYDINYGAEARHEDGPYADSHMDYSDWKVNEHSVAILYPSATVVNDIEGTLYVTCSLVLPSTYMLIQKARQPKVVAPWDVAVVFTPADMTCEVVLARQSFCDALEDRFIASLPAHVLRMYSIATLLYPRFKNFRFLSDEGRDTAVHSVTQEWNLKWKPKAAMAHKPKLAARKDARPGLTSLLAAEFVGKVAPPERNNDFPRDELDNYFSLPVADMHTCVIDWWQQHRHCFPYLNKIARQYLACPATSAGVERLFSAAGLTLSDLAQAMKEGTLGARLMAAYNYKPHMYVAP